MFLKRVPGFEHLPLLLSVTLNGADYDRITNLARHCGRAKLTVWAKITMGWEQ